MNINTKINSSSVILISGGGRGVTAQCAIQLAEQYQCKFILLGRSELTESEPTWARECFEEAELKKRIMQDFISRGDKPTPVKVQKVFNSLLAQREISTTISAIQQAGGQVKYLSADITNKSTLQAELASVVQSTGQITGIIHGAGVLADKFIENKTERDFDTVYAAKIEGLENLLNCVEPNRLDFIVLFSSFVAFYGNAGQSDYALANEILNKTAYLLQRKYPSCHVVSIGWGPWDGGMVTPELKKVFSQLNMELIPLEVGAQMLVDELKPSHHGTAQTLVMSSAIAASPKPLYSQSRTFRFRRKLTLAANSFVCDHAFGGKAVLPAMCSIAWIARACEQIYPGYTFFSCSNYKVLKGIIFDQSLATEYVLDVKEIQKLNSGEIDFEVLVWSESPKGIPYYHYSTQVRLIKEVPPTPSQSLNITQDPALLSLFPYQDGTLFHKRNFQGIKQILHMTSERLIARCKLDNIDIKTQGQFPVQTFNPYTSDLLFQCFLVWVRHFYNLASLPLQIQKLEQFQEIPFNKEFYISLEITSNQETNFFASSTVYDSQGQIYMQTFDMQVTASERLNHLFLNNSLVSC
ncbi:hypothetical protein NUACC21_77020 [Scytonema sp. NUACC21]